MPKDICADCVEDFYLQQLVNGEGQAAQCDACHLEKPNTITIARLGQLLEPILREHYQPGEQVPQFDDNSDKVYYEQSGDDLSFAVQEVLGQYFEFEDDIVQAVIDAEGYWPPDGDEAFFDRSVSYVTKPVVTYETRRRWNEVKDELQNTRRFFSANAKQFFAELFANLAVIKTSSTPAKHDRHVVTTLPAGFLIYRSRVADSEAKLLEMYLAPFAKVGPPPPEKASAGRMNAEGVPVLYAADEYETSLAELRPALSGMAAVITLRTTTELQILDFTRMAKAYKSLSYFQPDFTEQSSHTAFIRELGQLISRPIVPGHEPEYLITQVMMEYLAHIDPHHFDGVMFSSAQRSQGKNVVLFAGKSGVQPFPVEYVDGSIQTFRTMAIKYEHEKEDYVVTDGELHHLYDPFDD